ncbi:putative bifunctional diguanylate cyclase/phosphodiesterase [Labrys wisconsinensis]|uniref:Diguanylate cyclase (GGDEF)-like protein n=1 Tax=Labrys wisconsinensis TaxID=425677 RepID=A0ABU0J4R2_9HYPH|nr:EAL domain-containing protein [Labrys wisconsinensis]MDQ0469254.1 diguanylate cyclase (GGDEF)-like protein [Labrys wisconsinensis]
MQPADGATGPGVALADLRGAASVRNPHALQALRRALAAGRPFALAILRAGGLATASRLAALDPALVLVLPRALAHRDLPPSQMNRLFFAEPGTEAEARLLRRLLARTSAESAFDEARRLLEASNRALLAANREFRRQNARLLAQESQLSAQAELFQATLDNLRQGLILIDGDRRVRMINRRIHAVTGLAEGAVVVGMSGEDILMRAFEAGLHRDTDPATVLAQWQERLAGGRAGAFQRDLPDGRIVTIAYAPMHDGGWLFTCEDTTGRVLAERALAEQNRRFDAAIVHMPYGVCLFDEARRMILCNPTYAGMYDLPLEMTLPGTPLAEILQYRVRIGNAPVDLEHYVRLTAELTAAGRNAAFQVPLVDGRTVQIRHAVIGGGGYVATHEDITETLRAEAQIRYLASHDALTGLPNRMRLRERMEEALGRVQHGGRLAVLCLDLDRFKAVNDTLGHSAGDRLLQEATERVKACLGQHDTVARLGGDEFVVLTPEVETPQQAGALGRRIIEAVSAPYDLDGDQAVIGASVGIAFAPDDGMTAELLLRNADMALYRAKSDGRNICRFFERAMDARVTERRQLELDLRKALAAQEFEVYYQPVVDARSEAITACEALLRWHHPERGMVPPAEFIPLAEEFGLIVPLGTWVLRTACAQATTWPDGIKVAVNLSAAQFKSRTLAHTVVAVLAETGLAPNRLELEITESVLLADSEATLAILHHLRSLGVRIAMDDFGTGYSSLSYLRAFPFDRIKIDRSFVRELGEAEGCLAIVKAVAMLGASLGMATTAEGVETEAQMHKVREQGCTEAQGYYVSPPRPAHIIAELLRPRIAVEA